MRMRTTFENGVLHNGQQPSRNATVTNRKCFNCTGSGRGRKDGVTKMLPNLSAILAPFVNVRMSFRLLFGHSVFKEKGEEFQRVL